MALLTAGTKATTSLQGLQFQPSGMSATDLGNLMALIKNSPNTAYGGDNVTSPKAWLQNGILYLPDERTYAGIQVNPGDYILVDGKGWPIVVPGSTFATSWQHS